MPIARFAALQIGRVPIFGNLRNYGAIADITADAFFEQGGNA